MDPLILTPLPLLWKKEKENSKLRGKKETLWGKSKLCGEEKVKFVEKKIKLDPQQMCEPQGDIHWRKYEEIIQIEVSLGGSPTIDVTLVSLKIFSYPVCLCEFM